MRWATLALILLTGCDDTVFMPCGELTADWHGVQCTLDMHCISCHAELHRNPPVAFTVLPLDLELDLIEGTGVMVVPGDPDASVLWRSLSGELAPEDAWGLMPWGYDEPLPKSQIDHVRTWIENGAPLEEAP